MPEEQTTLIDDRFMENPTSPVCGLCVNLTSVTKRTCSAFPHGIPDAIWLGRNRHRTPFPGDAGIKFTSFNVDTAKKLGTDARRLKKLGIRR